MTRPSLREYAAVQRERDLAATRAEKGTLLNEVVTVTGLHRKAGSGTRFPSAPSPSGTTPAPGFSQSTSWLTASSRTQDFYLCTLCAVDIATAWVELEAIWGKRHEFRAREPVSFS